MQEPYNKNELRDIVIAVVTLTIIFAFPSLSFVPIAFVAVLIGFLFHELAHRYLARKFDAVAYFKMWPQGLLLGLLAMVFGVKAAAPGAVVVHPYRYSRWKYRSAKLTVNEWGQIAAVGPITNILFAVFFAAISYVTTSYISDAAKFIYLVNAVLAVFNLIPFPPLDGSKIMRWKMWFWVFLFVISVVLVLFAYV